MNLSTTLVLEYEAVMKRELKRQRRQLRIADDILDYWLKFANRRSIFFRWRPILLDAGDDFVLELAVASRADFFVTFNVKDFSGLESFGAQAIRPRDFLKVLEKRP